SLALFLSSFITQAKWSNFACLMLFALAVIMGSFLAGNDQIYSQYSSNSAPAEYLFLSLLPWVPSAKLLADIYTHSTVQFIANQTSVQHYQRLYEGGQLINYPAPERIGMFQQLHYSWQQIYDPVKRYNTKFCVRDDDF